MNNEKYAECIRDMKSSLGECSLFLKRNQPDFPLKKSGDIAAYGCGVRHTVFGGTGSGEVNAEKNITIEEGLLQRGFHLNSTEWLDELETVLTKEKKNFTERMKKEAAELGISPILYFMGKQMDAPEYDIPFSVTGDTAIYVVSRTSGEGNDRRLTKGDIYLSDTEVRDILALSRLYPHFLLVLNLSSVIDLSPVEKEVGNILLLAPCGSETGNVLADILLGKVNPSGKLACTWADITSYPSHENFGNPDDTVYKEGLFVGYRYFDSFDKPVLYPFGHGLSYTSFEMEQTDVCLLGKKIIFSIRVRNTGNFSGKEVAQIYLSRPTENVHAPKHELAAYKKTSLLNPGEMEILKISLDLSQCGFYEETSNETVLEKGNYVFFYGNSSVSLKISCCVENKERIVLQKHSALDMKPKADELICRKEQKKDSDLHFELNMSSFTAAVPRNYVGTTATELEKMPDEALAKMVIGAFDPSVTTVGIIGNSSKNVAGAAGETTSEFISEGIKPLVLADGPAGIRITPEYYLDENGAHDLGNAGIPKSFLDFLPEAFLANLDEEKRKKEENGTARYQYATYLPVATSIAQTWNDGFAENCGDIAGYEMEKFGIDIWLAPALNIQRDIRCGRNFEYYSEDPLLSGKMAAAVTRGVQSHPGKAATIKHFACNNQEFNRYGNNSVVSVSALRNIYLKGFEIALKESSPHCLMTSYNLVNGVHTAESDDLLRKILRNEFGFDGLIMTDWIVGDGAMNRKEDRHPRTLIENTINAGSNLFMPGCIRDYQHLMDAVKEKRVLRSTLFETASGIYFLTKKLAK